MKFDNEDTIFGIHTVKLLTAIVVVIYLILMFTTNLPAFIENHIKIGRGWAIAIVVLAYFLFYLYFIAKGTAYISYNDEGNRIIIRTFKIKPFNSPKMSFEIAKNELLKYSINKQFLKDELNLYVKKQNQISKYPPISIISITKKQRDMLVKALDGLAELKD